MSYSPPNSSRKEHDYILNELSLVVPRTGKKYNMTSHMIQLTYTEDIFSGCSYGSLFVDDSIDYPGLIPLIGEEKIKFILSMPGSEDSSQNVGGSIEFTGSIYKISDKEVQGKSKKNQAYTIYFISEGSINSTKTRVSKSWKNKKYSKIVKDIVKDYMSDTKEIFVEETLHLHNYISTNEKPLGVIKQIEKRSISSNFYNSTMYLFYEDRDRYNFVSMDSLIEKQPISKINFSSRNIDAENSTQFNNTVNSFHTKSLYDYFKEIQDGYISSKLLKIDPIRRKFSEKTFNLEKSWNKFAHTDKHLPFNSGNIQNESKGFKVSMIISDEGQDDFAANHILEKDPEIRSDKLEDVILEYDSRFAQIKKGFITVSLPGDTKYKAGETIEFEMPEILGKTSKSDPEEQDKFRSGKYLIASVAHIVKSNIYTVNMELIKDSFYNEVFDRDPLEEYKGIY